MNRLILHALLPVLLGLFSTHASAETPMELAKKYSCTVCHAVERTDIGPAWRKVSEKYQNVPNIREELIDSVLYGSNGKWTNKAHMNGQKHMPREDAGKLVDFILSLAKQKQPAK